MAKLARVIAASTLLLTTGCDRSGPEETKPAPAPPKSPQPLRDARHQERPAKPSAIAARPLTDKLVRSETVEARFVRWDEGDYVWAVLDVPGQGEVGVWAEPPVHHFLEAHEGHALTVQIDTIMTNIPEAGGETEVQRIASARLGPLTAQSWWAGLSIDERAAAERRWEAGPAASDEAEKPSE